MRITTRLRIISIVTTAALVVLAPILIWSFIEFKSAKNDYVLADAIKVNFFERASFRDQYFLYREDRSHAQWDKSNEIANHLLRQAELQFHGKEDREILEHLRKNIEDNTVIFHRIVNNTETLKTAAGNRHVYEELDRRLFSQLLLKATAIRDTATALEDASARRVELTYKRLTIITGLFAVTLALASILTSMHLGRLIRKRLAPLHDGAKIVAGGNLAYRIKCGGSDEFAELALSINAMTDKLVAEISMHTQLENALRDSEEKLQAVLNASEVAIAWANEDGVIEYANPKFISLFGYTLDDVPTIEQWYLHAYPDADYRAKAVDEWNTKVARSLPERTAIEPMEVTIACKDGSVRHAILMGSWARTRLQANFSDITARKKAENALRDSEIRYRSLVESSPMCIHEIGMDGRLISMNPAGLLMLGASEESKIRGLLYLDTVCDADRDRIGNLLANAYAGEISHFEFKSSGPYGQVFQSCFVPVKDGDGKVIKLMGITEDISKRKRIEEALQESERRYHSLFDNNPMPMWVFEESSLKFLMVNDRAVEHYGYTREEFSRMTLHDIRPAEDIPELDRAISGSPERGTAGEWRHKKKDGTIIDVAISTTPMTYGDTPARIALIQDITERKQAESERNRLLKIIEDATDYIGMSDMQGHLLFHNIAARRMLGLPDDADLSAMEIRDMHPEWAARLVMEEGIPALLRQDFWRGETALLHRDGHEIPVSQMLRLHRDASGKPQFISTIMRDITERNQAENALRESEASLRAILDNVPYLIWLKDTDGRFIAVNKAFFKTTRLAKIQDVLGKTDFDIWPEELARKYRADDAEVLSTRKQKLTEEISMADGEAHWVETFKAPIINMDGHLLGTTGFAQDITVRKNAEGKIRHLAHYDPLTDLPNRTLFSDRLQQALITARRDKAHLALMFLDLDKFKPINDALGHHVGDLLLKEAAKRMQDCVRESDTVARIGGDEFVVLLPAIEAEQDAMLVAEKIRHALNRPFVLVGQSLNISSSTGIAVYPEHGKDETQLVKNADVAMYHAKKSGRNNVKLYQPDMQDDKP